MDFFKSEVSHRHTWSTHLPTQITHLHLIGGIITGILCKMFSGGSNHTESNSNARAVKWCGGYTVKTVHTFSIYTVLESDHNPWKVAVQKRSCYPS